MVGTAMNKKRGFNKTEFRRRLAEIVKRKANNQPDRFGNIAESHGEPIGSGAIKEYLETDRLPRLDKAWAIAMAGDVPLDWLVAREPTPDTLDYKELLRAFMIREFDRAGLGDRYDLRDDEVFDQLARSAFQKEVKKRGK